VALITRIARYKVAELFLITKSGMLIEHKGITKDDDKDKDIVASMFVAVQSFIKDAFAEEDSEFLKRMDYGDKTVLIIMGEYILLTAFIKGQESKRFLNDMEEFIKHLEERFEGAIEMWDGNYENLPRIGDLLEAFFNGTFRKEFLRSNNNQAKNPEPENEHVDEDGDEESNDYEDQEVVEVMDESKDVNAEEFEEDYEDGDEDVELEDKDFELEVEDFDPDEDDYIV
jgi:hypothetical protein